MSSPAPAPSRQTQREPPDPFEDTFKRRVNVRLAFLGWTLFDLGAAVGIVEGRDAPISHGAIRHPLNGRRGWEAWAPRFARAMGCPDRNLHPRTDWGPLTQNPIDFARLRVHPDVAHARRS